MREIIRKKPWLAAILAALALVLLAGCTGIQMGAAMPKVSQAAATAPQLAHQLDSVYEFLVDQKAVPDNRDRATQALAALDAIAPAVQAGAESLSGDKFNWASFIINAAMIAAQVMGFVAPLL